MPWCHDRPTARERRASRVVVVAAARAVLTAWSALPADMLYSLYMDVVTTMEEYENVMWSDVIANIDAMTERVASFGARVRSLPARLREWQAFGELHKLVTEFQEVLPLLQELSKDSVKPRHWQEMEAITGKTFPLEAGDFRLRLLLEAHLHEYKEEIEELVDAADKQLTIEQKLGEIRDKCVVVAGQGRLTNLPPSTQRPARLSAKRSRLRSSLTLGTRLAGGPRWTSSSASPRAEPSPSSRATVRCGRQRRRGWSSRRERASARRPCHATRRASMPFPLQRPGMRRVPPLRPVASHSRDRHPTDAAQAA